MASLRTDRELVPPPWSAGRAIWFESRPPAAAPDEQLIGIKAERFAARHEVPVWQPITTAPFEREIELAVIDSDGPHTLVFPCRRIADGWVNAETEERIYVRPTHWRPWCPES